jgi:hypothetical protein
MIREINWLRDVEEFRFQKRIFKHFISPFNHENVEIGLSLTLDNESFVTASDVEKSQIDILKGFCLLPEIYGVATTPCDIPYQEVEHLVINNKPHLNVKIVVPENAFEKSFLESESFSLDEYNFRVVKDSKISEKELCNINLHLNSERIFFVSLSPYLLKYCAKNLPDFINFVSPLEALKIIGLFLRSRHLYYYTKGGKINFNGFYQAATVCKIPHLPLLIYYSTKAFDNLKKEPLKLASIIRFRCLRAIFTIDKLGELFFDDQSNDTSEIMVYYFDYLILLLDGAIDALARIIKSVYGIVLKDGKYPNLSDQEFRKEIKAKDNLLSKLISNHIQTIKFVSLLRNNIHGISTMPSSLTEVSEKVHQKSFVSIPKVQIKNLMEFISEVKNKNEIGMNQKYDNTFIEPFLFSLHLSKKVFRFIEDISRFQNLLQLLSKESLDPQEEEKIIFKTFPKKMIESIDFLIW